LGALAGWGVPEYEAVRFEGRVREGGILLSVHCDDNAWVKRAKEALQHTGAQDIASASERHGDFANADKPMPRVGTVAELPGEVDIVEKPRVRSASPGVTVIDEDAPRVKGPDDIA
jgi:hypothetical protein